MARFMIVTPDLYEPVILHLREYFFADEPLNKAVGLCRRGEPHEELERLCMATMSDGLSITAIENNQVDCIMECRIVSVASEARGRGMAKELIARSLELARQHGFRLFKVDATGAFSQRICRSLGMHELRRIKYSEYRDEDDQPIFHVPPPHHALCVMIKEIA